MQFTEVQKKSLIEYLSSHDLAKGLGSEESACSIAAINLAISGELTDEIPECMSPVIGKWIIRIQDAIPSEVRNSAEWKRLLPLAAGTGRGKEKERLDLILKWMWTEVLAILLPIATQRGFGKEWGTMLTEKTVSAARAARDAADAYAADAAATATISTSFTILTRLAPLTGVSTATVARPWFVARSTWLVRWLVAFRKQGNQGNHGEVCVWWWVFLYP